MKKIFAPLALLALAACGSSQEDAPPPTGEELIEIASTPFSIGETSEEDRIDPNHNGMMSQDNPATLDSAIEAQNQEASAAET